MYRPVRMTTLTIEHFLQNFPDYLKYWIGFKQGFWVEGGTFSVLYNNSIVLGYAEADLSELQLF